MIRRRNHPALLARLGSEPMTGNIKKAADAAPIRRPQTAVQYSMLRTDRSRVQLKKNGAGRAVDLEMRLRPVCSRGIRPALLLYIRSPRRPNKN